jgi:signal transduction histidine kinase
MKLRHRLRGDALAGAVASAMVVVILLGILQYRWSAETLDATTIRLADTLQLSMLNWHSDLLRNFAEICLTMRPERSEDTAGATPYAARLAAWRATAPYPDLVRRVYALGGGTSAEIRRLDLEADSAPLTLMPSFKTLVHALNEERVMDQVRAPVGVSGAARGWYFESELPALLHRSGSGWLLVELNEEEIRGPLFEHLAYRHFQGVDGLDYEVAVVAGSPRRVLYTSDAGFGQDDVADADGILNIFGGPVSAEWTRSIKVFHPTLRAPEETSVPAASWFPELRGSADADAWRLVVRHRRGGSLGTFVSRIKRRDMTAGFGALSLLVVSIGMLIVASRRAQRLVRLQLDFVTAVSHELRTPLTVITSAADNLVRGVVQGQTQLTQYGQAIGKQARQLSSLVEKILLFAATNDGRPQIHIRPFEISALVDGALSMTEDLVRAAGHTVERDVPEDLPVVAGDLVALTQAVQNLITNALKYSAGGWIGIRARLEKHGPAGCEIQLAIADRGPGIAKSDLPHIFEPFYRSPAVSSAQVHGTGLGLTLARRVVEAMNGRITVVSVEGEGSTFTIHLPCAEPAEAVESRVSVQ